MLKVLGYPIFQKKFRCDVQAPPFLYVLVTTLVSTGLRQYQLVIRQEFAKSVHAVLQHPPVVAASRGYPPLFDAYILVRTASISHFYALSGPFVSVHAHTPKQAEIHSGGC